MHIERLPDSLTVQYSELMQQSVRPLSDGANLSFTHKTIGDKRYWYLRVNLGRARTEHYLGEETTELLDTIDDEKEAWESSADDRERRQRLVGMLSGGGMATLTPDEGKVIALLERSGLFLAGGALVGTLAFRLYANMLGVVWPSDVATQDVDFAFDYQLALPRKKEESLKHLIMDSGLGFVEVPMLNRKQTSTSFKIRDREFHIDVLTPMRGRETNRPVKLDAFGTYATPLRHLDYLLEDLQPAVALHKHGILVNAPSPGRFALHKCAVSQKRPAAAAAQIRKDLSQAEQLFQALLDLRPADITLAIEAAKERKAMYEKFEAGLQSIDDNIAQEVRAIGVT